MFDIDYLTDSMNYIHVSLENQTNPHADEAEELIVVPTTVRHTASKVGPRKSSTDSKAEEFLTKLQNLKTQENEAYSTGISEDTPKIIAFRRELDKLAPKHLSEVPKNKATSTTSVNSGSGPVNTQHADQDDSDMPELTIFNKPQKGIFDEASYDDEGMVYDFNNLPTEVAVSPIPTLRIHNIHPQSQILGDPKSSVQTRSRVQQHSGAHALEEPKKISEALKDDSWVEAMQEELLQFRLQQVWILVDLPHGAKVIGTKWVYRNKRDERGVVVRNKARLGPRSQTGGAIDEEYKKDIMLVQVYVDDIIFGSTRKSWCDEFEALMKGRFQMSSMGELIFFLGLQVKQKTDGIFILKTRVTPEDFTSLMLWKRTLSTLRGKPIWLKVSKRIIFDAGNLSSYSDYVGANLDRKSTHTGWCEEKFTQDFNVADAIDQSFEGRKDMMTTKTELHGSSSDFVHTPPTQVGTSSPEPTKHTFEQPSTEHQPLSPRQEPKAPQSQDPSHPHVLEARSLTVEDLLHMVPTLITKVDSLETELKQTKQTIGKAIVKLVKKVKKLENILKRRNVVLTTSEDEEPEDQGRIFKDIDDDPLVSFVTPTKPYLQGEAQEKRNHLQLRRQLKLCQCCFSLQRSKSVDKGKRYKRRKEFKGKDFEDISTGFKEVNTSGLVNTGGLGFSTGSGPVSSDRGQREGKAPMIVEETQAPKRTKEQIQQEEASFAEAIRLQNLEEEETAKQVHLDALLAKRLAEEEELTEQQKKKKSQVYV
ncbi:putative ribonuclease H-like domain-containing protein [Tanacetum coccineum]